MRSTASPFQKFEKAGFPTTRHITKPHTFQKDILKSMNQKDDTGHRGIKIITSGQTTDDYEQAVVSVLKQNDWDVAFLSDIDGDPKQALGLILNRDVFIKTLDAKKLVEAGYNVIRVNPPVVIPEDDDDQNIVTSPSIKPVLVFVAVLVLIILAAWGAWVISR